MSHSRALLSFAARQMFLFAVVLSCAAGAFSDDNKGPAVEGPLLIAQLPAKHEINKYDLRYKFLRGDVLRYDVTHQRIDPQHDRSNNARCPDQNRFAEGLESDRRGARRRH